MSTRFDQMSFEEIEAFIRDELSVGEFKSVDAWMGALPAERQ